jgi:hypothetical protein
MHFGENQLSPRSFGISPLPTAHPTALQRGTVRASTRSYARFTLAMGSSRGFGSPPGHAPTRPRLVAEPARAHALFRLAFARAPPHRGLARDQQALAGSFFNRHAISPARAPLAGRAARGPLTARRRTVSGSLSSPSRGAFHLSLTVLVRYRSPQVVSLGGSGPPRFGRDSSCPALLEPYTPPLRPATLLDFHHLRSPVPGSVRARDAPSRLAVRSRAVATLGALTTPPAHRGRPHSVRLV